MAAWSGLWNDIGGADYALLVDKTSLGKRVARLLRQHGDTVDRELMLTLNGTVAGSTALAQRNKVQHVAQPGSGADYGGQRTIETVDKINRATTAADKTALDAIYAESRTQAYTADLSGNGGGGKLGV
jgi:hypothetical protein